MQNTISFSCFFRLSPDQNNDWAVTRKWLDTRQGKRWRRNSQSSASRFSYTANSIKWDTRFSLSLTVSFVSNSWRQTGMCSTFFPLLLLPCFSKDSGCDVTTTHFLWCLRHKTRERHLIELICVVKINVQCLSLWGNETLFPSLFTLSRSVSSLSSLSCFQSNCNCVSNQMSCRK